MSGLVYLTTFHAQDFKDIDGDMLLGRSTLPILFPHIARASMFMGMLAWSVLLPFFWKLDWVVSSIFAALGLFVGIRFASRKARVVEDQISFYWYNVSHVYKCHFSRANLVILLNLKGWVSLVHILPAYYRHFYM